MSKVEEESCHLNENEQETIKPFDLKKKEAEAISRYGNEDYFDKLAREFCDAKVVNGTAQDFINLSISFKQNGDYITACKILRRGLTFYINDIELLASYLNYAIDSGIKEEIDRCEEFYEKIRKNSLESYSEYIFNSVLKYLMTKKNIDNEPEKKSEINEILNMFSKQYPNSESSYFANYEFLCFVDETKSIDKLRDAVKRLSSCPRCALKLADILCDEGNYEEAKRIIVEKCLLSIQTLPNHNIAYVYYLLGVCELGIFQELDLASRKYFMTFFKRKNDKDRKLKVQEIYKLFEIADGAALDLKPIYKREIKRKIYVLEKQTGIAYS